MASTTTEGSRALRQLRDLVNAGRPLIYLLSSEEGRLVDLLREAASQLFPSPPPVYIWSLTEGMRDAEGQAVSAEASGARAALDFIAAHPGAALFLLKDFHQPMRESIEVRRRLRDVYGRSLDTGKFVFISSPVPYVPEELKRELALVEIALPELAELMRLVEQERKRFAANGILVDLTPGTLMQLARALQGLTLDESRHALRRAAALGRIDASSVPHLFEEKHLLVRKKTGVIEYVANTVRLDDIGGLPYLKRWLLERRKLFEQRDALSADLVPKGVLIMGVSGCGKSLAVKAIAHCFELPLYRVNMSEVFSGREGTPEATFAQACKIMEEMAPAVVWFDEIEMGISSQTDASGTLSRIFAFFLTWMQEKTRGLFVGATANRIDLLPAEMIRKGRFDEVFFVDLPSEEERLEIFRIHLEKRGEDPDSLDLDRLRQFTRGWTGAEIEQCVVSALTTAKLAERKLTGDDLLNMTAKIVPLSKTMKEQVEHIRGWALDRAVRAAPRSGERG